MKKYTFDEAMNLLENGNLRFSSNKTIHPNQKYSRLEELVKGQNPFATVLTCSDSRVVPEFIFDRGIGDLFVIRNAGNIVENTVLGSIEYAVEHLHTPIVLVLGHSSCGAVTAAVKGGPCCGHLESIMKELEPIVDKEASKNTAIKNSILNNVNYCIDKIKKSKPVIAKLIKENKVGTVKKIVSEIILTSYQVSLYWMKKLLQDTNKFSLQNPL
ncbi:MAG: carbonic anhydrase, partial [Candidatus Delongbacteria bacterium]|nr:carbonic anhydrase [Candidatus Delongbacteria bacterium]